MAPIGFQMVWRYVVPAIGYHHYLMVIAVLAIVSSCLVVAGASSTAPRIPELHVLSLRYVANRSQSSDRALSRPDTPLAIANLVPLNATLQVNIGYFGLCYQTIGSPWTCGHDSKAMVNRIDANEDPLNLVWQGNQFRTNVLFSPLIIISAASALMVVLLLSTFPGWHEEINGNGSEREVKPFPSRAVSQVAGSLSFLSSIFLLVSATWTHAGAVGFAASVDSSEYVRIDTTLGTTNLALTWVAFSAMTLVTLGLIVMILSISLLDRLTDEDSIASHDSPQPTPQERQSSQQQQQQSRDHPRPQQSGLQMTSRRRWDGDQ